jgi:hypothetical protein
MVSFGDATMNVRLTVGGTEAVVGEVEFPLLPVQPEDPTAPPSARVDWPAFRANLARLLREAADEFEHGDFTLETDCPDED